MGQAILGHGPEDHQVTHVRTPTGRTEDAGTPHRAGPQEQHGML